MPLSSSAILRKTPPPLWKIDPAIQVLTDGGEQKRCDLRKNPSLGPKTVK